MKFWNVFACTYNTGSKRLYDDSTKFKMHQYKHNYKIKTYTIINFISGFKPLEAMSFRLWTNITNYFNERFVEFSIIKCNSFPDRGIYSRCKILHLHAKPYLIIIFYVLIFQIFFRRFPHFSHITYAFFRDHLRQSKDFYKHDCNVALWFM